MLEVEHENLAVADLPGLGGGRDRLDHLVGAVGRNRHLDLHLGQESHGIFGAAVDLGMAALATVALDLGHGEPGDAEIGDGVADLVELERLDDGDDELHGCLRRPHGRSPAAGLRPARAGLRTIGPPRSSANPAPRYSLRQAAYSHPPPSGWSARGTQRCGRRSRTKPSWETEATSVPSRAKISPRASPRAPNRFGLSWA